MATVNLFYVTQKKETHTGLEQVKGEEIIQLFSFCVNYPFNI